MPTSLDQQLALVALDEKGTFWSDYRPRETMVAGAFLEASTAGAALVELVLAERLRLADRQLVVIDPTPLGTASLDRSLRQLAERERPAGLRRRLQQLRGPAFAAALEGLVAEGVLERVGGLNGRLRAASMASPRYARREAAAEPERALRRKLAGVMLDEPVDARTAALAVLARIGGLHGRVFPDLSGDTVAERVEPLRTAEWAPPPAREAVRELLAELPEALRGVTVSAAVGAVTANGVLRR